jgi:hypothetical protein
MIKSNLEKNIILNKIDTFKKNVKIAQTSTLIKVLPFLCAWGNLLMLHAIETKIPNMYSLPNRDIFMRMSLVSDNYEIVNYLNTKKCMSPDMCLRYYVCAGGSDINIYNLFNNYWNAVTNTDIYSGIKNGTINILKFLNSKVTFPVRDYNRLSYEKQKYLVKNNNILNYYIENNINNQIVLEELYERKKYNMNFLNSIIIIKIFLIKII